MVKKRIPFFSPTLEMDPNNLDLDPLSEKAPIPAQMGAKATSHFFPRKEEKNLCTKEFSHRK